MINLFIEVDDYKAHLIWFRNKFKFIDEDGYIHQFDRLFSSLQDKALKRLQERYNHISRLFTEFFQMMQLLNTGVLEKIQKRKQEDGEASFSGLAPLPILQSRPGLKISNEHIVTDRCNFLH